MPLPETAGPVMGGACGKDQSFLFTSDGQLYSCGLNACGQLGIGKISEPVQNFRQIELEGKCICVSSGKDFAVACNSDGNAFSWGSPEYGQLGNGTEGKSLEKAGKYTFEYRVTPKQIEGLRKFDPNCGIVQMVCGMNHVLARDAEGRLYSWGFGGYGRLGQGDAKDRLKPEPILAFCNEPAPPNPNIPAFAQRIQPKLRAIHIACGSTASYAIAGEPFFCLYFWGITKKAGEATLRPTIYDDLQGIKVVDVSCGFTSTVVATEDHMIITWGPSPTYGELGYGEKGPKSSTKVKEVESLQGGNYTQGCLASGYGSSFVLVDTSTEQGKKIVEEASILDLAEPVNKKRATSSSSKTSEKKTKTQE